jgi:hypothetical protein
MTHSLFRIASLTALVLLVITGCAGYRVGNISGKEVQGVKSVWVPMAHNQSYTPDIQATVAGAVVRRFDNDGTLETSTADRADSQLDITITDVKLDSLRSTQENVLITAEYQVTIYVKATFTNRRTGRKVFDNREFTGKTSFYVQQDLQEGKRQALPSAAEDLAYNIVKSITEGW